MSAVLAAVDLTAGFPGAEPVLEDAAFAIPDGARLALLGPNGSGKTTLLRSLAGSLKPRQGQVVFRGEAVGFSRSALREHRRRVQLVAQDPDEQLFSADVMQDVSFGPLNLGLTDEEARARVDEALNLLGVTALAERPTHQLSYGERKRVAIAGAVAMRPQVLLLDEPTAGLDPAGVSELLATLAGLETTVVLATHDVDLALGWADEVAVVAGRRVRQGPPSMLGDAGLLGSVRLRMPWQLDLLHRLGVPASPLPRGVEDVARLLGAP